MWGTKEEEEKKARLSFGKTLAALAVATVLTGGALSLAASSFPDGLEWSVEKLTGSTEPEAADGIYDTAASIQEHTALLPDYGFKNEDSPAGTSFSGIVGGLAVVALCVGCCYLFKFFRRKVIHE